MKFALFFVFSAIIWLSVAQQPSFAQSTFRPAPCEFSIPTDAQVECGWLTVPEDHSQPDGRLLDLHIAIFRSPNPSPDPIVFLDGGPGFSPLASVNFLFPNLYALFLRNHDLIIFDQRGTGYSEPLMGCPQAVNSEGIAACRQSLDGLQLDAYTSASSAADLETLRVALGYEQWNLYGVSYGTRLALTAMRDFPDGIRSVVLDSVYPPQIDLYGSFPSNTERAFSRLFDACAADPMCNRAYPDLETVFYDHVAQLTNEPALVEYQHPGSEQLSVFEFESYDLLQWLFRALYDTSRLPTLPSLIYGASFGEYAPLMGLQSNAPNGSFSAGLYYTLQCNEEVPFSTFAEWEANATHYPALEPWLSRNAVFGRPIYTICEMWAGNPTPNPLENAPVVSDIPTLILAGEFDPITPAEWGVLAAETLSNSQTLIFPGVGHHVFPVNVCSRDITLDFFVTLEIKVECMAGLRPITFSVPNP